MTAKEKLLQEIETASDETISHLVRGNSRSVITLMNQGVSNALLFFNGSERKSQKSVRSQVFSGLKLDINKVSFVL